MPRSEIMRSCGSTLYLRFGVEAGFLCSCSPPQVLGAAVFGVTTKDILSRTRPPAWMAARASGWASPSDHATCATAVYGALGYLIVAARDTWLARLSIWTAADE